MRFIVLVALLSAPAFAAPAAGADSKAVSLAKEADRFYRDRRFREAAEVLQQAWQLEPIPLYLYNIARAWEQASQPHQALESYRAYLAQPSGLTDPELVTRAKAAVERLEAQRQQDEARAEEASRLAREERKAAQAKDRAVREVQQGKVNQRALSAYIAGGVGVAALGTSLVFALLANGSLGSFRKATELAEKRSLEETTRGLALVTDLTLVLSLAAAVTAIVLYPKEALTSAAKPAVSLQLAPAPGGALVSLEGRF
jgi:tetratricopeptide (TPR) repeat protein